MSFQETYSSGTPRCDDHDKRPDGLLPSGDKGEDKNTHGRSSVNHRHQCETNAQNRLKTWAAAACLARLLVPSSIVLALYIVTDLYKIDSNTLYGVYILWGISGFLALSGITSLLSGHIAMLAAHLCMSCILTPAALASYTCWFFSMHQICQDLPSSAGCSTWLTENYAYYLLSIVGMVFCIPSYVEAYLCMTSVYTGHVCSYIKRIAREKSLQHMVDQQTRLLAAADAPTVTPETLRSWVSELLMSEDAPCRTSGNLCMTVLRRRGYKLHVITHPSDLWSPYDHVLVHGQDVVVVS